MARLNKKILAQIKQQIAIGDIADEFGLTVVPKSRGTFSLSEHDSVLIYPKTNSFYRYATNVGGDVLKFMEEMPEINLSFQEAYDLLANRIDGSKKVEINVASEKKNKYGTFKGTLAEKQRRAKGLVEQFSFDDNCKNAMAYLIQTRKIDPDIVKKLIHENCIKQETQVLYKHKSTGEILKEKPHENALHLYNNIETKSVVFIGHDEIGMVATACKRVCNSNSTFKGEYSGSDYSYGWLHDPNVISCNAYLETQNYDSSKKLVCFESYIDMLSFMTILKQQGSDYTKYAYLSCGSATKYLTVMAVQERIGYKNVTICFDNDEAGKLFANKLKNELENKGVKTNIYLSKNKDWNSELVQRTLSKQQGIKKQMGVAKKQFATTEKNKSKTVNKELTK